MDEKDVVRRIVEQARQQCRKVSGELRPWSVMARGAESLEEAVRGGGDPLALVQSLLEAVLEGFPVLLPDDERYHRENCLHTFVSGLLPAVRAGRAMASPDMDGMHKARLSGVVGAMDRMAASLLADPQNVDAGKTAWELQQLAQVVSYAVRDDR